MLNTYWITDLYKASFYTIGVTGEKSFWLRMSKLILFLVGDPNEDTYFGCFLDSFTLEL